MMKMIVVLALATLAMAVPEAKPWLYWGWPYSHVATPLVPNSAATPLDQKTNFRPSVNNVATPMWYPYVNNVATPVDQKTNLLPSVNNVATPMWYPYANNVATPVDQKTNVNNVATPMMYPYSLNVNKDVTPVVQNVAAAPSVVKAAVQECVNYMGTQVPCSPMMYPYVNNMVNPVQECVNYMGIQVPC